MHQRGRVCRLSQQLLQATARGGNAGIYEALSSRPARDGSRSASCSDAAGLAAKAAAGLAAATDRTWRRGFVTTARSLSALLLAKTWRGGDAAPARSKGADVSRSPRSGPPSGRGVGQEDAVGVMRELEFAVNAGDGVLLARKLFQITEIMRHTYSEQKEALAAEGGDTIAGRRRALREARQAVDGDPFASRIRALQTKLYKDLDGISHKDLTMALMALGPEIQHLGLEDLQRVLKSIAQLTHQGRLLHVLDQYVVVPAVSRAAEFADQLGPGAYPDTLLRETCLIACQVSMRKSKWRPTEEALGPLLPRVIRGTRFRIQDVLLSEKPVADAEHALQSFRFGRFALGLWQLSDVTERQSLARQMFSDWLEMYHTLLATPPADVVFPGSRFVRGSVNPNDLYKGFRTIAIAFASKDVPYREGPSWHLFPTDQGTRDRWATAVAHYLRLAAQDRLILFAIRRGDRIGMVEEINLRTKDVKMAHACGALVERECQEGAVELLAGATPILDTLGADLPELLHNSVVAFGPTAIERACPRMGTSVAAVRAALLSVARYLLANVVARERAPRYAEAQEEGKKREGRKKQEMSPATREAIKARIALEIAGAIMYGEAAAGPPCLTPGLQRAHLTFARIAERLAAAGHTLPLRTSVQVLAGLEKQGVRCTTALDAHGSRFISRLAAAANAQDAEAALAKRPELVGQLMHAAANYFTPNWRMRPREGHKGRAVTPGVVVAVQEPRHSPDAAALMKAVTHLVRVQQFQSESAPSPAALLSWAVHLSHLQHWHCQGQGPDAWDAGAAASALSQEIASALRACMPAGYDAGAAVATLGDWAARLGGDGLKGRDWDGGEWEMQGSVCVTVPDSDEASGVRRFAEGAADTWAQLAGLQEFRQTKGRMTMPTTADLLRWETEGLAALHLMDLPQLSTVARAWSVTAREGAFAPSATSRLEFHVRAATLLARLASERREGAVDGAQEAEVEVRRALQLVAAASHAQLAADAVGATSKGAILVQACLVPLRCLSAEVSRLAQRHGVSVTLGPGAPEETHVPDRLVLAAAANDFLATLCEPAAGAGRAEDLALGWMNPGDAAAIVAAAPSLGVAIPAPLRAALVQHARDRFAAELARLSVDPSASWGDRGVEFESRSEFADRLALSQSLLLSDAVTWVRAMSAVGGLDGDPAGWDVATAMLARFRGILPFPAFLGFLESLNRAGLVEAEPLVPVAVPAAARAFLTEFCKRANAQWAVLQGRTVLMGEGRGSLTHAKELMDALDPWREAVGIPLEGPRVFPEPAGDGTRAEAATEAPAPTGAAELPAVARRVRAGRATRLAAEPVYRADATAPRQSRAGNRVVEGGGAFWEFIPGRSERTKEGRGRRTEAHIAKMRAAYDKQRRIVTEGLERLKELEAALAQVGVQPPASGDAK